MSKHTPGPWKAVAYPADKEIGFATHEIQYGNDGECVAEVVHGEANAHLIEAAPIMLEALEKIARLYHSDRSCSLEAQGYNEKDCELIGLDDYAATIAREAIAKATNQNQEA